MFYGPLLPFAAPCLEAVFLQRVKRFSIELEHNGERIWAHSNNSGSMLGLLAPGNPAAADAYGWTLYGAGDLDGARQLVEKAVLIAPGHATLRWHLAQVYAALGRDGEAVEQARLALASPAFADRDAARSLIDGFSA